MGIVQDIGVCVLSQRTREGEGASGIGIIRLGHGGCQGVARAATVGRAVITMGGGDCLGTALEGALHHASGGAGGTPRSPVPAVREDDRLNGCTVGLKSRVRIQVEITANKRLLNLAA